MLGTDSPSHEDVAAVGVQQADHVLDADRLPGARRPEDHRDLALGDAEVQAPQHAVAAERLVDVDELDRVRHAFDGVARFRVVLELVVVARCRARRLGHDGHVRRLVVLVERLARGVVLRLER